MQLFARLFSCHPLRRASHFPNVTKSPFNKMKMIATYQAFLCLGFASMSLIAASNSNVRVGSIILPKCFYPLTRRHPDPSNVSSRFHFVPLVRGEGSVPLL